MGFDTRQTSHQSAENSTARSSTPTPPGKVTQTRRLKPVQSKAAGSTGVATGGANARTKSANTAAYPQSGTAFDAALGFPVQLKSDNPSGPVKRAENGAVDADPFGGVRERMQSSAGQPLDATVQAKMGSHFGTDFDNVKVHTGGVANDMCDSVGAKALTSGNDIYFGSNQYNPGDRAGQELLGHELTHVVQQSSGRADGLAAKADNASGGTRDTLEKEADDEGAKAADKMQDSGDEPLDWGKVDMAALKAHFEQMEANGSQIPVRKEADGWQSDKRIQDIARKFMKGGDSADAGASDQVQAGWAENYLFGSVYNRVEVSGIPSKFIEIGKGASANYNFWSSGHMSCETSGANSRRDGNFGVEISGSGGTQKYNYDSKSQAAWNKAVQKKIGGAGDRKTVSMHNWAFENIEASDWFDVVPGIVSATAGGTTTLHATGAKMAFSIAPKSKIDASASQVISKAKGVTTSRSITESSTHTRSMNMSLSAKLEKKDVGEVGSGLGFSSTNVNEVSSGVSTEVSKVASKTAALTSKLALDNSSGTSDMRVFVYPVWNVTNIKVKSWAHDEGTGKVTDTSAPKTFDVYYLTLDHLQDMPADGAGNMAPRAANDPGKEADDKRLADLQSGEVQWGEGPGKWVHVMLERERNMVKDYTHQKYRDNPIYEAKTQSVSASWGSEVGNSFTEANSSGQSVSSTGDWSLSAGGEYKGLGASFGYSEAKTQAASFGDSVATSGSTKTANTVTVEASIEGPSQSEKDEGKFVQVLLTPMYTERVYKYRLYDKNQKKWLPVLPQRTRSVEYNPMPAIKRKVLDKGASMQKDNNA